MGSAEAKRELPKPWKPTFPPTKSAAESAPPPTPVAPAPAEPPPRALTEPPPLPEPPERGSKSTIEESVIVDAELGARTSRKSEQTELVVPLKLGLDTDPVRKSARASRRRMLYIGGALAIFGAAALAVVLATSAELPKPVVSPQARTMMPAAAPSASVVAPKAEVVGEAVAPAPAIPAPAPAAIQTPIEAPVIEAPAIAEAPIAEAMPAPIKAARIKAEPSRPVVRKAIARPVKRAAKPKYDPDALFFKGN